MHAAWSFLFFDGKRIALLQWSVAFAYLSVQFNPMFITLVTVTYVHIFYAVDIIRHLKL